MGAIAGLKYPKKSHRKAVNLPKKSALLAEFFGIMIGDGGIGNPWQAKITVNAVADRQYIEYLVELCKKLFGVSPSPLRRKDKQAVDILINSTTLVDFLVTNGLKRGNKLAQGLAIPDWILAKRAYRIACIRGLVDTDGCIYVHVHTVAGKEYRNVGLTFSSHSPALLRQVADAFEEFGIIPHIGWKGRSIYLYSAAAVARYLKVFGTSNDRIRSVYTTWRGG